MSRHCTPRRSSTLTASVAVTLAVASGCQLIKVNGKPLGGGGGSASSSAVASPASPPANASDRPQVAALAPSRPGEVPAWCEEMGFGDDTDLSYEDVKDIPVKQEHAPERSAARFARVMCTTGSVRDRDQILALRDRWMQANELDVGDLAVLAGKSHGHVFETQWLEDIPGPISQTRSNGYVDKGFTELDQLGSQLSMVARFMLVHRCSSSGSTPLLGQILCTREPLDQAAADAEVDGVAALNLGTRYQVRQIIRAAARWHRTRKAELEAMAKADPGIAKLIAIANATFADWARPSARRARLLALVASLEAATKANKRSGFAGCDATTKAAWEEHLATVAMPKLPSKGFLEVLVGATLATPEGYLAYEALRACSAGSEASFYTGLDIIGSDVIRRGPRTSTIAAWLAAAGEIKFDDRSLELDKQFRGLGIKQASRWDEGDQGVIAAIKDFDGGVEITFKRVNEMREDCLRWVATGRLTGFTTAGEPLLERKCTQWGKVKFDLTADPIKTGKLMAAGLRPGMFLYGRKALPIVATASAKSSTPIWVLGGTVKK